MAQSQFTLPPPPIFGVKSNEEQLSKNGIISLDDIFEDFFLPENSKTKFQQSNDYRDDDDDDDDDDNSQEGGDTEGKKRKRTSRSLQRNMTEEQKVERRYN
jgi:hypothetical protein